MDLRFADKHCDAIIQAWYSGAHGGKALAELIFGKFSPSGRLPVTFYEKTEDLPDFEDYSMENRTYRYFKGIPLYPFGFGLSYTNFEYSDLKLPSKTIGISDDLELEVKIKNTGNFDGEEVVQIYVKDLQSNHPLPTHSLCGFKRIFLAKGEEKIVSFKIPSKCFEVVDENGNRFVEPGEFKIYAGPSQPDARSMELSGKKCLEAIFEVK